MTTQLLCILLAQALHALDKSSTSKCKFLNFPLLELNSPNYPCNFSNKRVDQILNHSSVSWEINLLSWKFIYYWQKQYIKVKFSDLQLLEFKFICFSCNFWNQELVFFKLCIFFFLFFILRRYRMVTYNSSINNMFTH